MLRCLGNCQIIIYLIRIVSGFVSPLQAFLCRIYNVQLLLSILTTMLEAYELKQAKMIFRMVLKMMIAHLRFIFLLIYFMNITIFIFSPIAAKGKKCKIIFAPLHHQRCRQPSSKQPFITMKIIIIRMNEFHARPTNMNKKLSRICYYSYHIYNHHRYLAAPSSTMAIPMLRGWKKIALNRNIYNN